MPLPDFLCVGAQKAGTTSLHDILVQHPEIYLPEIKETKFFIRDDLYQQGLSYYQEKYYAKCQNEKRVGEIDPDYLYFEKVPQRLYEAFGKDLKLIFSLRNPVDRAYSHYLMSFRRAYEEKTFEEAIKLEPERIVHDWFFNSHFSYMGRGLYTQQIERYLQYFSRENMFFIIFESEFLANKENVYRQLLHFLNLEYHEVKLDISSNPARQPRFKFIRNFIYGKKPQIIKKIGRLVLPSRELRGRILKRVDDINSSKYVPPQLEPAYKQKLLEEYFLEDINKLETLIDKDLSFWKSFNRDLVPEA